MEIRDELRYSKDHEWVLVEDNTAIIGISDFAQESLGDVVYVGLPEVGTIVEEGEAIGTIESVKAVSDIYSPVHGEVVEVNRRLEETPEIVNSSPFEDGWMIKLQADISDIENSQLLMDADAYRKHTEES